MAISRSFGDSAENGYAVTTIAVPTVIFQGEDDKLTPPAMAQYYEKRITGSRVLYFPNEGHLSMPLNQAETIMREVAAAAASADSRGIPAAQGKGGSEGDAFSNGGAPPVSSL